MEVNKFENHIRKLASDTEEKLDTDALWKTVSNKLNKKKRRPLIFWFIIGISVLAFSGLLFFDEYKSQQNQLTPSISSATSLTKKPIVDERKLSTTSSHTSTTSSTSSTSNSLNIKSNDVSGNVKISHTISRSDLPDKLKNKMSILQKEDQVTHTDIIKSRTSLKEEGTNQRKDDRGNNVTEYTPSSISQESITLLSQAEPSEVVMFVSLQEQDYTADSRGVAMTHILPKLNNTLKLPKNYVPIPKLSSQDKSNKNWSFGIESGIGTTKARFTLYSTDIVSEAFLNRMQSIEPIMNIEFSGLIGYQISPQIKLLTGLTYRQYVNKSTNQLTQSENILVDNVLIEEIVGPNGTEEIYGEGYITRETISVRERISTNEFISIPIQLELSPWQNQIQPFFGFNLDYSFVLKRSGFIHLNPNEEYDINKDEDFLFSSNLGISAGAYIGARMSITHSTDISARLFYRKEFFSHFNASIGFNEKYSTTQFKVGFESKF